MNNESPTARAPRVARDYIPLLCWALAIITFLFITFKIIGYGFLPPGDARRHYAKAFTDKPYSQIIVMSPIYRVDHSPGWEWLLKTLHREGGLGMEAIINVSIAITLLGLFLVPLLWLHRPEAWVAALMAIMIAIPDLMTRFVQARPYLVTEAVLIAILFSWSRPQLARPSWLKLGLTTAGFALSVWIHGAWYLWVVLLAAFFASGWWRTSLYLTGCCVVGTLAGATLTGSPFVFLRQALEILAAVSREHAPQWLLVGELRPSEGEFTTLVLLAIVCFWRRSLDRDVKLFSRAPLVWLIVIGWLLGFKADRFWADWGLPAAIVFLAVQAQEMMSMAWEDLSSKRVIFAGIASAALFMHATNDLERRYTMCLSERFIDASDPDLKGWLPDSQGVFYAGQMEMFYNTFFKNPQGDWRYIIGMEPALMPEDDLKIYRRIQWNDGAFAAFEPWIDKMRPADRLAIPCLKEPTLPRLEWHEATAGIWLGRLPRAK
jgi:hypothetical protein